MVQLTLAPVRNENLFTKHYLEERLRDLPEWEEEEEIKKAFEEIKDLWEQEKDLVESYNEAQLEDNFIKKIFEILNHSHEIQGIVRENALRPDYGFFKSNEDRKEAHEQKSIDGFYKDSIAIGEAKKWGISLDKKTRSGRVKYERSNPSWQIYVYLKETPAKWGLLTNGKKWRLYNEQTSDRLDTYYEVDLPNILENDNREEALQEFKYFYLFFRQKAFLPTKESFLDKLFEQSERYAQEIGENLEDSVYKALLWMAKGYFSVGTNNLEKNRDTVEKVHKNSLIFLYRLLFLLYAESKGMLGTEIPRKYEREWSFSKWLDDVISDIDKDKVDPMGALYHWRLKKIFRLVREGSESIDGIAEDEFHVPAYNGGLFSQEKYPFLNRKKIRNPHLADVVELLVRAPSAKEDQKGRIDYSDLSLRHLGGIYEGLLEYKLELAEEDMVSEKKKGTLKWIPASKSSRDFSEFDEDKRAREGELYLVTENDERKATGSYYTPDYIVKYIVENTIEPVIDEKLENAETEEEKRNAILSTKVLDPAMGSGHFLVETIDTLARRLVEFAENGGKKRDIDWARREIARNCIYGVDVNPLATELAKVSLWLNTMAEDKPLSFLDHHLKTGNSLIGADLHKLDKHPEKLDETTEEREYEQQTLYGKSFQDNIKKLLDLLKDIGEVTEESPEDIKEEEQLLKEFESHPFKKKFDVLADVQTSYYFGNEFSKEDYSKLLDVFRVEDLDDIVWEKLSQTETVRKASDSVPDKIEDNLSEEKRFFHWKLEFPEIFFDIEKGMKKDNPGFDAVIGNPPWVRIHRLEEDLKNFLEQHFKTATGQQDLYTAFIEQSFNVLCSDGFFSFINPKFILFNLDSEEIRKLLLNKEIDRLIDSRKAFEEVNSETIIEIVKNTTPNQDNSISIQIWSDEGKLLDNYDIPQERIDLFTNNIINIYCRRKDLEIIKKMKKCESSFGNRYKIRRGGEVSKKYLRNNQGDIPAYLGLEVKKFVTSNPKGNISESNEEYNRLKDYASAEEKILVRRVADRLIGAKDSKKAFFSKNNYGCIPKGGKSHLDIDIALLNSSLLTYFFKKYFTTKKENLFPEIQKYQLEELPFLNGIRNQINSISIDIQEKKKAELEEKGSFLSWLEREWNVDLEDISRKTYLKEYWKYSFNEDRKSILKIAKHNKNKIDGNPSARSFQEKLKEEWVDSMNTLNPLMEEIQGLENQIDAIVFDLYDLNEEEVITVLDSLETEEKVKEDILEKFREVRE